MRPDERKVLEAGAGVRMELLAWGNTVMEPHLFRIAPEAGSGESYTHEGEEFIYVLRGELEISCEGEEYRLKPGDSFYFESATPHRWKNPGPKGNLGAVGQHAADFLAGDVVRRGTGTISTERRRDEADATLASSAFAGCVLSFAGSCAKKTPTLNLLVWEGYADPSFVKASKNRITARFPPPTWDRATNWWPSCAAAAREITT